MRVLPRRQKGQAARNRERHGVRERDGSGHYFRGNPRKHGFFSLLRLDATASTQISHPKVQLHGPAPRPDCRQQAQDSEEQSTSGSASARSQVLGGVLVMSPLKNVSNKRSFKAEWRNHPKSLVAPHPDVQGNTQILTDSTTSNRLTSVLQFIAASACMPIS